MKTIVTDLDGTIIFSYRRLKEIYTDLEIKLKFTPIEYKENKPISYIHNKTFVKLDKYNIIPCTTRTKMELDRVEFFKYRNIVITSNGGKIYYKGNLLENYSKEIETIKSFYDYEIIEQKLIKFNLDYSLEDDTYFKIKSKNKVKLKTHKIYFDKYFSNWKTSIQGNKLYLIPQKISKEYAVNYLLTNNYIEKIDYTFGDTLLDIRFLSLGKKPFVRESSEISDYSKNKFNYNTFEFI